MLEKIKTFRMVVICQGFRSAAKVMKVSPAIISRRIESLEYTLKTQLIKRNSRKILLTTAGQRLFNRCQSIIDEFESCMREVKNLSDEVCGCLKVGIPHSINHFHIIPNLDDFFKNNKGLKLEIVTGNHSLELFSHGFDLAFQCGPLPDSNFYYTLIGHWRKYTCISREYALNHEIPKTPQDLHNHNCLLHFDNHRRSWKYIIDKKATEISPAWITRVNNSLDLYQMVKHGLGISYLPDFTVNKEIASGEIIPILEKFMPPPLPMYIVHVNPYPSLKELKFINFVKTLNIAVN